jgi:hypothetical protein
MRDKVSADPFDVDAFGFKFFRNIIRADVGALGWRRWIPREVSQNENTHVGPSSVFADLRFFS